MYYFLYQSENFPGIQKSYLDNREINTIIIKKAPFYKKAPLISPGSELRGAFLKSRPKAENFEF